MKTTLLIMAAGIGSRFGTGIKQLEPVDDANHIIMDYSIHDAIEAGFNHVVFIIRKDIEKEFKEAIGNRIAAICSSHMLHFEKGIYCAFVESGVLQGDVATYKTNFGVTLTSKGNRRTLDSFMGYKRSDMDGNVVYVDAPYKVYGFSIQYRRYLTTAAKREREEAV